MFCHCTNNEWAHHSRQRPHAIGDSHQNAGITRSYVQVIDIEAYKKMRETVSCTALHYQANQAFYSHSG